MGWVMDSLRVGSIDGLNKVDFLHTKVTMFTPLMSWKG
jgi:hypothetical protein